MTTDANIPLWRNLARQHLRMGRLDQAAGLFEKILTLDPDHVPSLNSLAHIATRQRRPRRALACLETLTRLRPDAIAVHIRLGIAQQRLGMLEEARASFRRGLQIDPSRTDLHAMIANITRFTEYDDEIRAVERRYLDDSISSREKRELAFALGKMFDDLAMCDKAFGYFAAGNKIADEQYAFSVAPLASRNETIRTIFDADFLRQFQDAGMQNSGVIIVTGLPRSGTTLTESMLASHSQISSAGESRLIGPAIRRMFENGGLRFPHDAHKLDFAIVRQSAGSYVDALRNRSGPSHLVVDKSMGLEVFLGALAIMLPGARIIHCRRDPRDAALSCFQKDFGAQQKFSYDLKKIAHYFRFYDALLAHWRKLMPERFVEVRYEHLCAEPESAVRGLLASLELEFEPNCLEFHKSQHVVETASLAQVRKPVYGSSVGRWKQYEKHLRPFVNAYFDPRSPASGT